MLEKRKPERRDRTAAPRPAAGGRKRAFLGAIQKTGISVILPNEPYKYLTTTLQNRKVLPALTAYFPDLRFTNSRRISIPSTAAIFAIVSSFILMHLRLDLRGKFLHRRPPEIISPINASLCLPCLARPFASALSGSCRRSSSSMSKLLKPHPSTTTRSNVASASRRDASVETTRFGNRTMSNVRVLQSAP